MKAITYKFMGYHPNVMSWYITGPRDALYELALSFDHNLCQIMSDDDQTEFRLDVEYDGFNGISRAGMDIQSMVVQELQAAGMVQK